MTARKRTERTLATPQLEVDPTTLAGTPAGNAGQIAPVSDQGVHRLFVRDADGVLAPAAAVATTTAITMEVDYATGVSPPAGTIVTSQDDYDELVAGFSNPYLKYPQDAIDILPPVLTNYVHILLKAGEHFAKPNAYIPDYSMSAAVFLYGKEFDTSDTGWMQSTSFGSFAFARCASIYFEGEWQVDETEQGGVISGAVLTKDSGTWTPGEHVDRFVRIISGAGAGTILPVIANDATTITLAASSIAGACQFDITSTASVLLSSTNGVDDTQGISFHGPARGEIWLDKIQVGKPTKRIRGFFVRTAVVGYFCRMYLGSTTGYPLQVQGAVYNIYQWTIVDVDGTYPCILNEKSSFTVGYGLVRGNTARANLITVGSGGRFGMTYARFEIQGGYTGAMIGVEYQGSFQPSGAVLDGGGTAVGIEVKQNGVIVDGALEVDDCTIAIDAKRGSTVALSTVSGSGNDTAWKLTGGAFVVGNPTTLAGTIEIDIDGETLTYADIPNAGDGLEGKGGSRILR